MSRQPLILALAADAERVASTRFRLAQVLPTSGPEDGTCVSSALLTTSF